MRLTVRKAQASETYKDVARVHEDHRGKVSRGGLGKLSTKNGKSTVVAVRGLKDGEKSSIWLDGETRRRLGVKLNETHDFTLSKVGLWGMLRWALYSSDPAVRVPIWLAIVIGALFAIPGLLK